MIKTGVEVSWVEQPSVICIEVMIYGAGRNERTQRSGVHDNKDREQSPEERRRRMCTRKTDYCHIWHWSSEMIDMMWTSWGQSHEFRTGMTLHRALTFQQTACIQCSRLFLASGETVEWEWCDWILGFDNSTCEREESCWSVRLPYRYIDPAAYYASNVNNTGPGI